MSNPRASIIDEFYAIRQKRSASGTDFRAVGWSSEQSATHVYQGAAAGVDWSTINSVLDVGSGFADFYNYLQTEKSFLGTYTGIELVESFHRHATEKHADHHQVTLMQGDFLETDFGEAQFDWAFSLGSMSVRQENQMVEDYLTIEKLSQLSTKGFTLYINDEDNLRAEVATGKAEGPALARHDVGKVVHYIGKICPRYRDIRIVHPLSHEGDFQQVLLHVTKESAEV